MNIPEAEAAYRKWDDEHGYIPDMDSMRRSFLAGARWALMEAADTLEAYADGADAVQDEVGYPAVQSMIEYTASANFLRAEAAAIGGDS